MQYEPGSDGQILHVLTSPRVVTARVKRRWTGAQHQQLVCSCVDVLNVVVVCVLLFAAKSLLRDVATAQPPVHALVRRQIVFNYRFVLIYLFIFIIYYLLLFCR